MDAEGRRRRIGKIAAVNGWSVAILGGLCLATSLLWFSVAGLLIGGVLMTSGCMELSGRRRLKQNKPEAGRWLAGSQLLLLAAIIIYAAYNLLTVSPQSIKAALQSSLAHLPAELQAQLSQFTDPKQLDELVTQVIHLFRILYVALIVGTVLYQGGLCLYYTLSTRKLEKT